ncbi:Fic family protein [Nocardia sp. NPDC052278]|uniref:Fic family protein n=1 Tax=unclassified Nocardia TaxID=2637762 RepID=UPI00368896B5
MTEIHQRLSRFTAPDHGGVLSHRRRWAPQLEPLTDKEKALIEANPYLDLLPPGTVPTVHGGLGYRLASPEAVHTELGSLSDWYNTARAQPGTDPYRLAAELQQRFVSIHPWDYDYNGRSSRLLMNWALEREGLPPAPPAISTRICSPPPRNGQTPFEKAARRSVKARIADPIEVFGLEREHERYLALNEQPPSFTPGEMHDINAYKSQLAQRRDNGR